MCCTLASLTVFKLPEICLIFLLKQERAVQILSATSLLNHQLKVYASKALLRNHTLVSVVKVNNTYLSCIFPTYKFHLKL